jgi:hypothetical protein
MLREGETMRSALQNPKRNSKANGLGSTVIAIKRGFDAGLLIAGSIHGIHLTAIPGTKKIIFTVQLLWSIRKAIVLGRSAGHRIRLAFKSRRRCAAGSLSTINEQSTT